MAMRRRQFIQLCATAPLLTAQAAAPAVVVVGAGFGGLRAARLVKQQLPAAKVTLIEQNLTYESTPYSHFMLTGIWPLARLHRPYDKAARASDINVVHATAARVQGGAVMLSDGGKLPFDRAIIAPGIGFDYTQIEGVSEAAQAELPHAYRGAHQLELLRRQLISMPDNGVFMIIPPPTPYRCSPAPYQRASMVAHYMEQHKPRGKVLILDQKEQFAQQTLFSDGWNSHYRQRIEWLSADGGGAVQRINVKRRVAHTEFGEERADVINYIAPQRAAALAVESGLADNSGWCPVDPATMESTRQRGVYVIGDAAALAPAPKSASCAMSQAALAAAAVVRDLTDAPATLPDTLTSVCFSHIAPEVAFAEHGSYHVAAQIKRRQVALTPRGASNEELRQTAARSVEWYKNTMQEMFNY